MVESTSDNQGLVSNDFSEDAVKIGEQSGLGESPIEQVWQAVLGTGGGSCELDIQNTDVKEQYKPADTLVEMMESGAKTAQAKIQEATNPEGSDAVDNSEVKIK
jgi:hypothetical protein